MLRTRGFAVSFHLTDPELLYVALMGLWRYSVSSDTLAAAMDAAERVYSLAKKQNDPALMIGGCTSSGNHPLLFGGVRNWPRIYEAWPSALALWRRRLRSKKSMFPPLVFFALKRFLSGMPERVSFAMRPWRRQSRWRMELNDMHGLAVALFGAGLARLLCARSCRSRKLRIAISRNVNA